MRHELVNTFFPKMLNNSFTNLFRNNTDSRNTESSHLHNGIIVRAPSKSTETNSKPMFWKDRLFYDTFALKYMSYATKNESKCFSRNSKRLLNLAFEYVFQMRFHHPVFRGSRRHERGIGEKAFLPDKRISTNIVAI